MKCKQLKLVMFKYGSSLAKYFIQEMPGIPSILEESTDEIQVVHPHVWLNVPLGTYRKHAKQPGWQHFCF